MLIERELCLFEFSSRCDIFYSLSVFKSTDLFFNSTPTQPTNTQRRIDVVKHEGNASNENVEEGHDDGQAKVGEVAHVVGANTLPNPKAY